MECQVEEAVFQVIGVDAFDGFGDEAVQFLAAGADLHAVGCFAQQGMAEDIAQFGNGAPNLAFFGNPNLFGQQVLGVSSFAGKLFAGKHELGEYRELEFPPDDGSRFDGFAG